MPKRKRNSSPDLRVALAAADAFRNLSQPFLQRIGRDIRTAHERAAQDIGGMIASATNLPLAVELYLKALLLAIGLKVPQTHDLWDLIKNLPKELRDSIEQQYNKLGPPLGDDIHSLEVRISVGPFAEEQVAEFNRKDTLSGAPDDSLKPVLKRNKNAFQTWRYLHEVGDPAAISLVRYEFHYLGTAADAVRNHVVAILEQQQGGREGAASTAAQQQTPKDRPALSRE